jgi:hypothetical protein
VSDFTIGYLIGWLVSLLVSTATIVLTRYFNERPRRNR